MSVTCTIQGGVPLYGSVRLGGAKNASFKLMIASLLTDEESRLLNFSHIKDVEVTQAILTALGGNVRSSGERMLCLSSKNLSSFEVPAEFGKAARASTMFLGPLLARKKEAIVPLPGGDAIGKRPIDRHLEGLQSMGANIEVRNNSIYARSPNGLQGTTYRFVKKTHTGTETLLMAAVLADGQTILENVALEPEVDDLIAYLNAMGAIVRRESNDRILVEGVKKMHAAIHKIMPDRNEAVSYACAAIASKGDIVVENAQAQHLQAFLAALDRMHAGYEVADYGIRFFHKEQLRATSIVTTPHPGFMTDWQPLFAVLLTQAVGESTIHEMVSESRFQYVESLQQMGANIRTVQLDPPSTDVQYQFDNDADNQQNHAIAITGPTPLKAGEFYVNDLRAGATLLLAGLLASGTTILHNVEYIDRGYEEFDTRLSSMGARIIRTQS